MNLEKEIDILYKVYNTLYTISTKGQETLYMASCLNAITEVIHSLEAQNVHTVTVPIDEIKEE